MHLSILTGPLVAVLVAASVLTPQVPEPAARRLLLDTFPVADARGATASSAVADLDPVTSGAGRLRIDLPDGVVAVAGRERIEHHGPDSVSWYGRLVGEPHSRVILTAQEGVLAGSVHTRGGDYALLPERGGRLTVRRLDHDEHTCLTEAGRGGAIFAAPASDADRDQTSEIDVLVLYSPSVAERQGGRSARAAVRNFVAYANDAFENSEIPARLRLLDVLPSPAPEPRGGSPLGPFARNADVGRLREAYGADLVSLVHNGPERCGRAYVLQDLNDDEGRDGFSSLAYNCGDRTFTHEVGHNLGFQHDPEWGGTDFPSVSPAAYGHWVQGTFRTIMSNTGCFCSSIAQFSNPRLTYGPQEHPTGIDEERDNARVAETTTPFVAEYRPSRYLFDDDFDSGDLDAWRRVRGDLPLEDLRPTRAGFALTVPLGERSGPAWAMHRVRRRPEALDVDFSLSIRHGKLRAGREVEILNLMHGRKVHTRVVLERSGAHRLVVYTRDGDEFVEVARARVKPSRPAYVRLRWQRASTATAADGVVALFVDGVFAGESKVLDNGAWNVTQIRVGIPAGIEERAGRGAIRIDDYSVLRPPPELE